MKRLIWLPLAGFLIIAGAAAAVAAPTITAVASGAVDALTETSDASPGEFRFGPGHLLEDVLADLVDAGTITQEQSDAIVGALATEAEARRTAADEQRDLLLRFIADGVIAQDEIDQLPPDSPLREIWNGIAEDGQLDLEQLRELGPGFAGHSAPGLRHGPGPWFMDHDR